MQDAILVSFLTYLFLTWDRLSTLIAVISIAATAFAFMYAIKTDIGIGGNEADLSQNKKYRNRLAIFSVFWAIVAALFPSQKTVAISVAAGVTFYAGQKALNSPEAQKLILVVRKKANASLDEALK